MLHTESGFTYVLVILGSCFVPINLLNHLKLKREAQFTEFDKALSHFKLASVFYGIMLYVSLFYLPTAGIHPTVNLDNSQEEIVKQLVQN